MGQSPLSENAATSGQRFQTECLQNDCGMEDVRPIKPMRDVRQVKFSLLHMSIDSYLDSYPGYPGGKQCHKVILHGQPSARK